MVAQRKLTDEQIAFARLLIRKRREVMRQARLYPTIEQLAEQLGCTPRYLTEVVSGRARSTGNSLTQEQSS